MKTIAGNTPTKVGEITTEAGFAYVAYNIANDSSEPVTCRIYFSTLDNPKRLDVVEPGVVIDPNGNFGYEGRLVKTGEKMFVEGSVANALVCRFEIMNEVMAVS